MTCSRGCGDTHKINGCSQERLLVSIRTEEWNLCGGSSSWSTQRGLMVPQRGLMLPAITRKSHDCLRGIFFLNLPGCCILNSGVKRMFGGPPHRRTNICDACRTCSILLLIQGHLHVLHQQLPVMGTGGFGGRNDAVLDRLERKSSVSTNTNIFTHKAVWLMIYIIRKH